MEKVEVSIFWLRRDLRLEDNHALTQALNARFPVLPIFIFDEQILDDLDQADARLTFIYDRLKQIHVDLEGLSSTLYCVKGSPETVWKELIGELDIQAVYANEDYEPYAIERDKVVGQLLSDHDIPLHLFKDQVVFAKDEVSKEDDTPYTVFTPFKNKWLSKFRDTELPEYNSTNRTNFFPSNFHFPDISEIGFQRSTIEVVEFNLGDLGNYEKVRNFPALDQTSYLSPHLRFGTVSIRQVIKQASKHPVFLSELIWREFFMQILYHFPSVVDHNFKRKYDFIEWRNDKEEFEKWKTGQTGYPIVDAGMRQLNATGYMHNRVRMITAGFLCKHLLIDWRWGEAYFAKKLLDYELSSNNGNWQWSAGTGCDAAPYFRVFNPSEQIKKFDPDLEYIKKWIPELYEFGYPAPMVDHQYARERALETYKKGIRKH